MKAEMVKGEKFRFAVGHICRNGHLVFSSMIYDYDILINTYVHGQESQLRKYL
jgi:hypothetical protein